MTVMAHSELKIIAIEDEKDRAGSVLKQKTMNIVFPLSQEDLNIIALMKKKLYELEGVGLAAPQVNFNKRITVIYIPETAALLRDNVQTYPMHVLINPEYEPVKEDGIYHDFESCYSVNSRAGKVPRFNTIALKYQDENGERCESSESGFYARVLQHEIDHLNGTLITDRLTKDCVQGSLSEMLTLRRKSLTTAQNALLDQLLEKKMLKNDKD